MPIPITLSSAVGFCGSRRAGAWIKWDVRDDERGRYREAADGAAALEACNAYRPQLVLMDIVLPDANGIELTARLGILYPGIQVIVVSQKSGDVYVQQALAAGARAYVSKDHILTELVPAVAAAIGIAPATDMGAS